MRIPDLNKILSAMLKTYDGISDLNFTVGHPLQVEDFGELKPVFVDPPDPKGRVDPGASRARSKPGQWLTPAFQS